MNAILKPILDRVEQWSPEAQEALARAALDIEQRFRNAPGGRPKASLLEVMQNCPFPEVEFARERDWPPIRDVLL